MSWDYKVTFGVRDMLDDNTEEGILRAMLGIRRILKTNFNKDLVLIANDIGIQGENRLSKIEIVSIPPVENK